MTATRVVLGVALAIAALVMLLGRERPSSAPTVAQHRAASAPTLAAPTPESAVTPMVVDAGPAQVRGWEGTATDGELRVDARGRIVIDLELRRLFDYFLSARGVLNEAQITNRLLQQAQQRNFTQIQRDELRELFERYRRYLAALGALQLDSGSLAALRASTQARQQLRRAALGMPMAEAFFADDEAEEGFALARMELLQDRSLTAEQRALRLETLLSQLPPQLRAAERDTQVLAQLDGRVRSLGAAASDPSQLYAARAEVVGAEAAQRLAALDAEDAAWRARMQALESERARIRARSELSATEQQRLLDAHIDTEFSVNEALRARAQLSISDTQR